MGDGERREDGLTDQSTPFDQIIELSNLPTIIKYDPNQEVDPYLIGPGFDSSQVYLLHASHEVPRVLARSARFQPSTKTFQDSGLDVTIDQQYGGWFAVFGSPSEHGSDPVVPHYTNIGRLSLSHCETFLVSGTQPLEGMKVLKHEDGSKSLKPFRILPGVVFTKVGMFTVSLKIKVKKRLFQSKTVNKDETYLACRDELQNEILIPCNATGIFYVISQVSGQIKTPVLKMDEIITRYKFPLLVKLVHGRTMGKPPSCSGTFVLMKSQLMKTAFASTVYAPLSTTIEIAADSSVRFYNLNASHTLDLNNNNNNSGISKAYQNYSDQMPSLLQTIRFRRNEQGLASARSSSTSGHGSGLSDDEEKVDWSTVTVCSNSPFIENVDAHTASKSLFTHRVSSPPTTFQTQISVGKNSRSKTPAKLKKQLSKEKEKTKTIATAIKRTTMYDTPKAKPETIPIHMKQQASKDNDVSNASTLQIRYENIQSPPTSPTSPTASEWSSTETDSPAEYCALWSDTSSVISGESMEVEVENVTHTDVSGHVQDAAATHEYKNLSSELALSATVRLRDKRRRSLKSLINASEETSVYQGEVENTYDVLSDKPDRNTVRGSYHKVLQPIGSPTTAPDTSDVTCGETHIYMDEVVDGATGPLIQQGLSTSSVGPYEEPTFGNHYERPRGGTYEKPNTIMRTDTYEKPRNERYDLPKTGTYVNPQPRIYDRPTSDGYVIPSPQNYDESENLNNNNTQHDNSFQDDGIVYEFVENVYECIADFDLPKSPSQVQYVNVSKASEYVNTNSVPLVASTSPPSGVYRNLGSMQTKKISTDNNGLYINTPLIADKKSGGGIFEKLILNMKTLGLKPATEETIRTIDPTTLELTPGEESTIRNRLNELFPNMNKIDLNKVSLFIDGTRNS